MRRVIRETCDVIFEALAGEYLGLLSSTEKWENFARDFQETWNLPQGHLGNRVQIYLWDIWKIDSVRKYFFHENKTLCIFVQNYLSEQ